MIAYHNAPEIKSSILAQLEAHRVADEIVKGQYWEGGKGCAVGCTVHSSSHAEYETRFGIPQMLARLEDAIFEGLPNEKAAAWPIRFMDAITPGADLSRVGWKFLYWLLTDEKATPGILDPRVRAEIKACADVLLPLTEGKEVDREAASRATRAADASSWAAEAASKAAWAARAASSAAEAASRAAWAEWAADDASSAAWDASRAAGAAWAAEAAEAVEAARAASWVRMSEKLLSLLSEEN